MTFKQILNKLNRRDTKLLPKNLTFIKLFLILLIGSVAIFYTKTILAADTTSTTSSTNLGTGNTNAFIKEKQEAMVKGNNQESWIDSAISSNALSLQVALAGTFPDSVLSGKGVTTKTAYIPGGMIGINNQIIASTFTPMASGVEYVAQIKENLLGKPAYAAETGFQGLKSIMGLWKVFRNVVYVLISLVFVAMGIMIMLRIKISPQATVTIQSTIPKIITTLILVTFSYAIAGFCIDLINLFQAFAISLLFNGMGKNLSDALFPLEWTDLSIANLINAIRALFGDHAFNFTNLNGLNLWGMISLVQRLAPNALLFLFGTAAGTVIGSMAGGSTGAVIGLASGGLIFTFIITLIIFIYLVKFSFGLAKCYINALLRIIFAPFELLLGAFPNSKIGFGSWIINLIANLAVFPVSVVFLILANILIDNVGGSSKIWAPTLLQGPYVWVLPIIIGIAAISILSQLPTIVPQAIFQLKPSPFGKALGEGFKSIPGAGLLGYGVGVLKAGGTEIAAETIKNKWQNRRTTGNNKNGQDIDFDKVPENQSNPNAPSNKTNTTTASQPSRRDTITPPPIFTKKS